MGKILISHPGAHPDVGWWPPLEAFAKHVEKTDTHWYWLDEFLDDRLERTPVFRWVVEDHNVTTWAVARLLWCIEHDALHRKHLTLENTCGLYTCINPAHWMNPIKVGDGDFTLPSDSGGSMRSVQFNRRLRVVHIVPADAGYTMCGLRSPNQTHPTGDIITCAPCLKEWRGYGRPLLEVKP